ncbi:uncharacterized protein LTR77_002577 [Saxophila tyrrhenica]|uniref:Glycosyltransferase family 28 N-terminal domain-containing protein n=1 Tax=Saxophila tyrrhenica TaxID=1690608 RepID=A0AAV9PNS5_9PEZI|nr:hypothetical protein LTR77_002577 [Saxophila tyrrhenica]
MADQPISENNPFKETDDVQQTILQQAQAAATAQVGPRQSTSDDALLQEIDLTVPDASEDDTPPPAYGDTYGEIRNEKDGLGTSASVTDDGRVNIRINQLNRRLSQVFVPALRQQLNSVQDSQPPPPPYIPPSLGGEEGGLPPPCLNIVIQVVGSRGDVQPFIALGKVLKETYGHRVRLATHPTFKDFVQEHGLEFFSIGGDPSRLMAFMVRNPGLMPGFRNLFAGDVGGQRRMVGEYIQGCWRSCYETGDGTTEHALPEPSGTDDGPEPAARPFVADCIIANPPSFAHIHCAEKLGISLHIMFTMPYSPTQAFPHPLANIQSSNADAQLTNYISYAMIEILSWQGLGDIINRFRAKCLRLDPISLLAAPGMLQRLKIPHTYCWSPALIPKPKDWGPHISIAGFSQLSSGNYIPASDLQAFLDAGPPPVYIGFGSIVLDDPNALTELIFEAVGKTGGRRVLLSKGWGGLGADELRRVPEGVFMLGNVPHDWLFQHVSCVVHHGGAGTTAAGITAGRPTLVVPFFGDQPFWGAMVARAGAGPEPIPYRQLMADKLSDAIDFCLRPDSVERAKELASKIAAERGSDTGAQSFHQHLEVDRLRCALAPSRAATWRIKRTNINLSPFAACTLANAELVDFQDLKLFRPQEHYTDEGPWDPISGGFAELCRSSSSILMGLADVPSETWKAVQSSSSKQQSQGSFPPRGETSNTSRRPSLSMSPAQSQTSLTTQESLAPSRKPSKLSVRSSATSAIASSSTRPKQMNTSQIRFRRQHEPTPYNNRDMLRQSSAHSSKGLGRMLKPIVQAPMTFSTTFTQGWHNMPKMWGDDTVRPQERVSDFKSGIRALGREFGLGYYDAITGLWTQPWNGAQREGTSGFFKGMGKGIGGFVTKMTAAHFGILSHPLKGVYKEVEKLFGSNVQSYIVVSRVAQGYEEWLQSSDAEKGDVIERWKLIQKSLKKKKGNNDEVVRDVLEAQQNHVEGRGARHKGERTASSAPSGISGDAASRDPESAMLAMGGPPFSPRPASTVSKSSLESADINSTTRPSDEQPSEEDAEEEPGVLQAIQQNVSQLQHQRRKAADNQSDQ